MVRFVIQPHVRLHEWVAEEKGFVADEGLDCEFEAHGLAGASLTTSSVKPADAAPVHARSGAFEEMEKGRSCDVSGACHWAVNAAASCSHGRMWGKAYSICTSGIFVAPESDYQRPEDLAGRSRCIPRGRWTAGRRPRGSAPQASDGCSRPGTPRRRSCP